MRTFGQLIAPEQAAAVERGEFYPNRAATDEQIRAFFLEIAQHWFPAAYTVPTPVGVGWMTLERPS